MTDKERVMREILNVINENSNSESVEHIGHVPEEHIEHAHHEECSADIPVGISNRHVHLCREDLDELFGKGYELHKTKDLSQPGFYACEELVTISGPKGKIEKVRVLGPLRSRTQVEVLKADCFKLGIKGEVRISGNLDNSAPVTVRGPRGSVCKKEGLIIAKRHIHINPEDAAKYGVHSGENVSLEMEGERGGVFSNVEIRITDTAVTECHLDTEEANAFGITSSSKMKLIK